MYTELEKELNEKELPAPRITRDKIVASIKQKTFIYVPGTTLTLCVATLYNGYAVVGKSACASPENYDEDLGERLALEDAINKCWGLLGFQLASELSNWRIL